MLRTLGFLTGVGLSIAALLLVLEPADLRRLQAGTNSALAQIMAQQRKLSAFPAQQAPLASPVDQSEPRPGDSAPQQVPSPTSNALSQAAVGEDPAVTPDTAVPPEEPAAPAVEPPAVAPAEPPGDIRNHLFWNPFRSESAAMGFADRLSSATDVAVTVTAAGPASYRVGFGYRDEAELHALIERIETVTGLELE